MESEIYITYVLMNILLIGTYIIAGQAVSRGRSFWQWAALCILVFTFVQGMRYGRGNDYIHYTEVFCGLGKQSSQTFTSLNSLLAFVGFNKYTCFIFYAFVFSTCGMIFLQNYRETAKWSFPLFVVTYIFFHEYQIRQAFSYSFFFLFMHYLIKIPNSIARFSILSLTDIALCTTFGITCYLFHSANSILIIIFLCSYLFVTRPIGWYITIPIYLLCVYVIPNIFDFTLLKGILFIFSDVETMSNYVEHSDFWFGQEGSTEEYLRNPYVQFVEVCGVSSLLYLSHKHIINNSKEHFCGESAFYYSFFIGTCILSAFRDLELLNRIGYDLALVSCFLLSIVLYSRNRALIEEHYEEYIPDEYCNPADTNLISESDEMYMEEKKQYKPYLILYLLLAWFIYDYLKYVFFANKMTRFLWDVPFNIDI